ncbi:hypothetical protein TNCV_1660931 [Trichonephila clavipes]|nr:hypothetical protein TNCV_1660931 [Trichonephila clavipes]
MRILPEEKYEVELPWKKGAGNAATGELTRERRFSERTLDAEVDDPGLRKERREQWPSRDLPPVVHKRDA